MEGGRKRKEEMVTSTVFLHASDSKVIKRLKPIPSTKNTLREHTYQEGSNKGNDGKHQQQQRRWR
jgi:hypothetical protein